MFSDKKKESMEAHQQQNKIAKDSKIKGDIVGTGCFRIEGKLEGTLKTEGKVVLGETGFIEGQLECENADLEGEFSGEIKITDTLVLKSTSKVEGEIETRRLSVEPGAQFNASCAMKEQVKSIKDGKRKKEKKERQKQGA